MFDQVTLESVESWLQTYGLWIVFVSLALENILFLSMIVPGLLVLLAAGFLASGDTISLSAVLIVGVLAVWLGDVANYTIGRYLWNPLFSRSRRASKLLERTRGILADRGRLIFAIYHFEPFTRMVGAAAVGVARVPLLRWLPFDFLGAALWVVFYGSAGYLLGRQGRSFEDWTSLGPIQVIVLLVILAWLIVVTVTMRRAVTSSD